MQSPHGCFHRWVSYATGVCCIRCGRMLMDWAQAVAELNRLESLAGQDVDELGEE